MQHIATSQKEIAANGLPINMGKETVAQGDDFLNALKSLQMASDRSLLREASETETKAQSNDAVIKDEFHNEQHKLSTEQLAQEDLKIEQEREVDWVTFIQTSEKQLARPQNKGEDDTKNFLLNKESLTTSKKAEGSKDDAVSGDDLVALPKVKDDLIIAVPVVVTQQIVANKQLDEVSDKPIDKTQLSVIGEDESADESNIFTLPVEPKILDLFTSSGPVDGEETNKLISEWSEKIVRLLDKENAKEPTNINNDLWVDKEQSENPVQPDIDSSMWVKDGKALNAQLGGENARKDINIDNDLWVDEEQNVSPKLADIESDLVVKGGISLNPELKQQAVDEKERGKDINIENDLWVETEQSVKTNLPNIENDLWVEAEQSVKPNIPNIENDLWAEVEQDASPTIPNINSDLTSKVEDSSIENDLWVDSEQSVNPIVSNIDTDLLNKTKNTAIENDLWVGEEQSASPVATTLNTQALNKTPDTNIENDLWVEDEQIPEELAASLVTNVTDKTQATSIENDLWVDEEQSTNVQVPNILANSADVAQDTSIEKADVSILAQLMSDALSASPDETMAEEAVLQTPNNVVPLATNEKPSATNGRFSTITATADSTAPQFTPIALNTVGGGEQPSVNVSTESVEKIAESIALVLPESTDKKAASAAIIGEINNAVKEFVNQKESGREPGISLKNAVFTALEKSDINLTAEQQNQVAQQVSRTEQLAAIVKVVSDTANPVPNPLVASPLQAQSPAMQEQHFVATADRMANEGAVQVAEQVKGSQTSQGPQERPIPVHQPEGQKQVAEKIRWMVNSRTMAADIRLDPPELGSMQIRVNMAGDSAAVSFVVQSVQARDVLAEAAPRLREMLAEQGINLGESFVAQQDQQQNSGGEESQRRGSAYGQFSEGENEELTAIEQPLIRPSVYNIDAYV